MKPTAQKHLDAINAGRVFADNVAGLRKLINASERKARRWSIGATACAVSLDELAEIEEAIGERHPRVEGALHMTGRDILKNPRYAKRWGDHERAVIENFSHFRLVRFDRICTNGIHCVPVYAVHSRAGGVFYFRNIPWQSGGDGPEIVGEDYTA